MSGAPPDAEAPLVEKVPVLTRYAVGLLHRAKDRPAISQEDVERIQAGHIAHLHRLERAGELIIGGPVEGDLDLREVLIFSTESEDAVRELLATDPAIAEGRLVASMYTWTAPAGLRRGPPPLHTPEASLESDFDLEPD